MKTASTGALSIIRIATVASGLLVMAGAANADAPPTTPQGITLVEVMRELPVSQPEILWVRLGNSNGFSLFTYEKDKAGVSNCVEECEKKFQPVLAPRWASEFGDWTTLRRDDGSRQWAYQQKPLYTWVEERTPGEVATNVGLTETANSKFAEDAVQAGSLLPPDGWNVARFKPAASRALPIGFDARLVHTIQAVALTDSTGHTLYVQQKENNRKSVCASEECESKWIPMIAPELAAGMHLGDFSVTTRSDGAHQWMFQGKRLFAYGDDKLPGDALGAGVDDHMKAAVLTKNFQPANAGIKILDGYGATLTRDGLTLYGGYPFEKRWGGRNLRDTFTYLYSKGKVLGDAACAPEDDLCRDNWKPYIAPSDAEPSGFWEPIDRQDGRKQWAYKGYALYTYSGDETPGDHYGQATYDFAEVEGELSFQRVSFLQEISEATGGVGVYWNIAKP